MTSVNDFFIGLASISGIIGKFWQYELIIIGENVIKVSNIVLALLLALLTLAYSNKISKYVANFVRGRLIKDKKAAHIIEKVLLYLVHFILLLVILQVANIPLNIFAFIGGAFAISAGLGAQNLTNNFISGLLVLIENPIKLGDIIKIGDSFGKVVHIGFRCTIIENFHGINIVVPNSEIMQTKILNWNYSSNKIKYDVNIHINNKAIKNHKLLAGEITKILSSIGYHVETHLLSVKNDVDIFGFAIELETDHLSNLAEIKNIINLALLENLKHSFSIEYPATLL